MKNLFDRAKLFFSKDREFRSALYAIMGFYPHNIDLYRTAFAHKSQEYRSKRNGYKPLNNERLEFLGDAVLETVVSDIVYRHFPNKREGFLTNTRSKIVSRESLGQLAKELHIDRLLQSQISGRSQKSYLPGNTFEALMGAIYLDRGFRYAYRFVEQRIIGAALDLKEVAEKEVNFKSKLLEWCQKNKIRLELKEKGGQGNNESFHTTIIIEGLYAGDGRGISKKESHQSAAKEALTRMRREVNFIDQIFRAKEGRTAMEANEVFCLPKIAEIEAELAKEVTVSRKERSKKERSNREEKPTLKHEKKAESIVGVSKEKAPKQQASKVTEKTAEQSEKSEENTQKTSPLRQNLEEKAAVADTPRTKRPLPPSAPEVDSEEKAVAAKSEPVILPQTAPEVQYQLEEELVEEKAEQISTEPLAQSLPEDLISMPEASTAIMQQVLDGEERLEDVVSADPNQLTALLVEVESEVEEVLPPEEHTIEEHCQVTTPLEASNNAEKQESISEIIMESVEVPPTAFEPEPSPTKAAAQVEETPTAEESVSLSPAVEKVPVSVSRQRKMKLAYPWPVMVEEEEEEAADTTESIDAVDIAEAITPPDSSPAPETEESPAPEESPLEEETLPIIEQPTIALELEDEGLDTPQVEEQNTPEAPEAPLPQDAPRKKMRRGRRAGNRQSAKEYANTIPTAAEQSHRGEKHERRQKESREQRAIERAKKMLAEATDMSTIARTATPASPTPDSASAPAEKPTRRRNPRRGASKRGEATSPKQHPPHDSAS